jgi:GIY-YIG catalytic domain
MLTINELLYKRGLPQNAKTKFVRHADKRFEMYNSYKYDMDKFLLYQSEQSKPIFHNCDFIVSFLGDEGKRSRFIGVYKVNGFRKEPNNMFYYNLTEVEGYDDLKERVIIDWGSITRSWHQWVSNVGEKTIIEILPINSFHKKSFSDYLDFILDFSELKEIINNKDTFREWHLMLSAVKGVYLILDKSTGNKYIGSAYSENGIFGRWKEYVNTNGHGNNQKLKVLLGADKNYSRHFQFTILMTLPKTMTANEVIEREQLYKQKLGTRTFGLNIN